VHEASDGTFCGTITISGYHGTAVCHLPMDHEGPCDGGATERFLLDIFAIEQMNENDDLFMESLGKQPWVRRVKDTVPSIRVQIAMGSPFAR
jgi:hypothetical protein